ncbi:MAG: family 78 glycoside hydrolase catalytic domain [Phycisphaerales bacterium]|nr:MAG: family 78 glycoside hydrolase catalytic domain [Phycisphaerales bacterium]
MMNAFRGALAAILVVCCLGAVETASADLAVDYLRCEYDVDPLGIDAAQPRLSWLLQSSRRGQVQTAYRVLAASSAEKLTDDQGDLWDSGKVASAQTHLVAYRGKPLGSSQRVFWKVRVWDRDGVPSAWSAPASWIMGVLRKKDWRGHWISGPSGGDAPGLPIFRKRFNVDRPVRRALVHVCGLGHYELFLNGDKVGDRFLDPAWSVYEKTACYTTYDITSALRQGDNAFSVMLGKGFYNTAGDRRVHGVRVERPLKLILQAHIELADGTRQRVVTDDSWRVTDGPITHCAILGGSDYDARRLPSGWSEPDFEDSSWSAAAVTEGPGGTLRASSAPPMKVMQVFEPVRIDEPEPGVFVYDFGQNASAVPRLRVRGQAGQVVKLTPAEQRFGQSERSNDGHGRVNQAGVGKPNYWAYTLRGDAVETWTPQFTYGGFQYIELTGAVPAGRPNPESLPVVETLASCHVRNAAPTVGSFECSDPLFNDIHRLIDWAVRSNLGHVLTDCPHREKLGWLEVSYLMEPSIACRYDVASFYRKVTNDIRNSQDDNGAIYTVAPDYPRFDGGFRYTPEWGAAGVILPWQIYQRYGDRLVLAENYVAMKRFVDYLRDTSRDLIPAAGLGDWYDYGHGQGSGPARFTSPELTAMATFYRCTRIVADTAALLGNESDHGTYATLAEQIERKFNATYFNGQDEYANHGSPQTANAMAVMTGLVPIDAAEATVARLVADIRSRDNQQTAGDVGFSYLVQALARYGRHEVLYDIARRRELGSYGYIRDHGWTSLPEAWDANTSASMNHCMLGHIQQWFYGDLAGIQRDPDAAGFKKIVIRPQLVDGLTWVKASRVCVPGKIVSEWKRDDRAVTMRIVVPVNTTATIYVPTVGASAITESGRPIDTTPHVRLVRTDGDCAVLEVGSGSYTFVSRLP